MLRYASGGVRFAALSAKVRVRRLFSIRLLQCAEILRTLGYLIITNLLVRKSLKSKGITFTFGHGGVWVGGQLKKYMYKLHKGDTRSRTIATRWHDC